MRNNFKVKSRYHPMDMVKKQLLEMSNSKNGIDAKIDVLAYANSSINEAYVVEVKSHRREEAITHTRR